MSPPHRPATRRVLVADDDPSTRRLFTTVLQRAGLATVEAADGQEVLERLGEGGVDVVVLDARMPRMDGLQVLAELRARPETHTLPVILVTGSAEAQDRIDGLEAGANDYLTKPVHPPELVARIRSQLRGQDAWIRFVDRYLRRRASVVEALSRLRPGPTPESTAHTITRELRDARALPNVAILAFAGGHQVVPLAVEGALLGRLAPGQPLSAPAAEAIIGHAATGPWVERRGDHPDEVLSLATFGDVEALACAPLRRHDRVIGCLVVAPSGEETGTSALEQILSAAIDYAAVSAALLGPGLAVGEEESAQRADLHRLIDDGAFFPVFQPVVELATGRVIGYEALTRFSDGSSPARRFADAAAAGLTIKLEEATMAAAMGASGRLPGDTWMSANVSPSLLTGSQRVVTLAGQCERPVVYELTEHDRVDDYGAVRAAVRRLGPDVRLSVDDAGSGYNCLHHVLALSPAFVKLDRSWIAGVDADPARQALVAGLGRFASTTGAALIAEGIERPAEVETLRALDVPLGQGFLLGRPAPVAGMEIELPP